MKYSLFLVVIFLVAPQSAPANTPAYAHCGTYDSYILLYKSVQKFEELGKLHCGESVEITGQDGDFTQVRTTDGRLGWVPNSDLSSTAPPPQDLFSFGWTEKPKPEAQSDQPPERPTVARVNDSAPLLTNVDVMKMQGAHLSPDTIIARLDHSRCDFDMSPAALHRLKLSGVSDRIILAMMHAPAAFSSLPADAPQTVEVSIPNQTAVQVALSGDVSSEDLQEGSIVEMFVVQAVTLNGVTLFPRGAEARARIMAIHRSSMGSSVQVVWFMQDITAATGDHVPANFATSQDARAVIGNFAGYPYFLSEFHKGAPAIPASSDRYTALVDGNIPIRVQRSLSADQSAAKLPAQPAPQIAPATDASAGFPAVVQAPGQQAAVKP
jgi:Bacterial SH3 domain